jgi:methyltransferase (TIGR00027 family)
MREGQFSGAAVAEARANPALRSRFAEDAARRAIARGVRQIVVLGAGLDTFAYRVEPAEGLRVFEVDQPATQGEKRRRLAAAAIAAPPHVVYVGCDFETESLAAALAASGFDAGRPSFFLWFGVVPYLTQPAIFATLAFIGKLPGGAEVVFDYSKDLLRDARAARKTSRVRLSQHRRLRPQRNRDTLLPRAHPVARKRRSLRAGGDRLTVSPAPGDFQSIEAGGFTPRRQRQSPRALKPIFRSLQRATASATDARTFSQRTAGSRDQRSIVESEVSGATSALRKLSYSQSRMYC